MGASRASMGWVIAYLLLAAPPAPAQSDLEQGWSRRLEVEGDGVYVRHERGPCAAAPVIPELTPAGVLWVHTDGGAGWVGSSVSIGEHGTQVFSEYDQAAEAACLLSAFDQDPPQPVWTDGGALGTINRRVVSAEALDAHLSIHEVLVNGNVHTRRAVVSSYRSSFPTPVWQYAFAPLIDLKGRSNFGISRDGQRIVAVVFNDISGDMEIARLAPHTGAPLAYTKVHVGSSQILRGFDLSSDGSILYFTAGTRAYLFDVLAKQVLSSFELGVSLDSHGLSGDGSVLATGDFNRLRVWQRSGSSWVNTFNRNLSGACFVAALDVSDDGSTVAYGFTYYDTWQTVRIEALDVAKKQVTMANVAIGAGSLQNSVAAVSASADGRSFAAGLWGDQAGLVHELRIYSRSQNQPVATVDLPGSLFDVEITPDGQRVAAAGKALHANQAGAGGRILLYDVGGQDLRLRRTPSIGHSVAAELHGTPGLKAWLLRSDALSVPPIFSPGLGTLYIDRETMTILPMGVIPASGVASLGLPLPNNPALIGRSFYFQGMTSVPRLLTETWIKMTVLP
jgi:hypothetical protein